MCAPKLDRPLRLTVQGSSKVDLLLEQLEEVTGSGHKALVFSQFTTLLGIVRGLLDAKGVRYEYLDGSTKNRQARVDRFQTVPDCPLFLISLKAGGVGLNLTAADYVFLLDPWWNPAVEERVLELQQRKRDLADAILGAANGALGTIGREELEALLA